MPGREWSSNSVGVVGVLEAMVDYLGASGQYDMLRKTESWYKVVC